MKKLKLPLALAAFLSCSNLAALPQSETQDSTPEEEFQLRDQPSDQGEVKTSAVQHTPPHRGSTSVGIEVFTLIYPETVSS